MSISGVSRNSIPAALPPMSPREISSDIDKMIEAGAYIYEFSRTWDQTIGKYVAQCSRACDTSTVGKHGLLQEPWQLLAVQPFVLQHHPATGCGHRRRHHDQREGAAVYARLLQVVS